MTRDLIQRLAAASSEEEKYWLLTEALLQQQPAVLADLALAAAVLRWFDLDLVRHFLPAAEKNNAADWLEALKRLSFVERYPAERWNVHELTRQAILWHLWREEADRYRALSAEAAAFFDRPADDWPAAVERLYHRAISEPGEAHQAFHDLAWDFQLHDNYLGWEALDAALSEHRGHGRLDARFSARTRLSEAGLAAMQYRHADAQQHYRQALALFQQVQDRLGEANCLLGLAAVEAFLNQHADAQQHYRQALALYQQVQDRLGEANCLKVLAAVEAFLKQHADAQQHYRQALALYQQVQDRLGEA
ncbi:MAG: tetratricopeptide repeat protein, partial [Anaerolineae bacterium]